MPRRLSPSALKDRMAPQNFSRGLASVVTTMVPGWNGWAAGAFSMDAIVAVVGAECNWGRRGSVISHQLSPVRINYGCGSSQGLLLAWARSKSVHSWPAGLGPGRPIFLVEPRAGRGLWARIAV